MMPSDTDATGCSSVSPRLELRTYQIEDAAALHFLEGRGWLFNEMGTGKTPTAIKTLYVLGARKNLIVCPKIVIGVWVQEIKKWWPGAFILVYEGKPKQREEVLKTLKNLFLTSTGASILPVFVITNYALSAEIDAKVGSWDAVIYDEAHTLCNRKTKLFEAAQSLARNSEYLLLLTGTPIRRNGTDLWHYLHLIDPKKFRSYWAFCYEYFHVQKRAVFGGFDIIGPKNPTQLQDLVKAYGPRRRKSDAGVLDQLPEKQRQAFPVKMTELQAKLYKSMAEEMMIVEDGKVVLAPNGMAKLVRLRQLLVSPRILDFDELGAGIATTTELAAAAIAEGQSVVVFTPFTAVIPTLIEELSKIAPTEAIYGGIPQQNRDDILHLMSQLKCPRILIASSSMGVGWSAAWASVGIALGYPFTPIECLQCEDRLHRYGQENKVMFYYIMNEGTVDEHVMEILDGKTTWARLALDPHLLLKRGSTEKKQVPS